MAAPSSAATACFVSPLPPPRRPRHFLRHLARAAAAEPTPASASSFALPSPWPWARRLRDLVPAEAAGRLLSSAAGSLIVALASASLVLGDAGAASAFVVSTPRKLQADELATVRLFQENTPSVVYITNLAVRQDAFTLDVLEVPQGSGSGFVWDKSGHIVTNFHVIRGASDLRVTLADQSVYEAQVVGFDQDKDVAVLRIEAPKDKLRPIPVGVSADLLVGQKVYAIGNPFGLDHTLTTGVISGLRREISSAATGRPIQDVIQTDAAINPGWGHCGPTYKVWQGDKAYFGSKICPRSICGAAWIKWSACPGCSSKRTSRQSGSAANQTRSLWSAYPG
uniref:Protease Do-like 1, chloroplastic n=1 Tax=Zea mays TaxID=4577 RepID=A0A804QK81_MAIZE